MSAPPSSIAVAVVLPKNPISKLSVSPSLSVSKPRAVVSTFAADEGSFGLQDPMNAMATMTPRKLDLSVPAPDSRSYLIGAIRARLFRERRCV